MSQVTEQIKERLGVAEIVGEYLKLEKAGSNYKALCPFHNEKTPSFMINAERNFWYCFGCQKGGDIFTFVQEMEGLEFREVLERLAERAGVEIPHYKPEDKKVKSQKERILEALELATKVYQFYIQKKPVAEKVRHYLAERKLNQTLQEKFRVGYAPDNWHLILDYLKKKGYSQQEISQTGLLVEKDGRSYDRFRGRIMFPVTDITGKVIGFSARVGPGQDDKSAKYINTPQTIVYDKSRVIFGLYQAKAAIKQNDLVIVVEGNVDVILSHAAEVENVVAVSGTALTLEQAKILKRYTNNVRLCLDMDEAGQKATQKSVQIFLSQGMDVEVITLPKGNKDVGDLVAKGIESWQKVAQQSQPILQYYFNKEFINYDADDIKQKKKIASRLLNIIKDIADPIEQNYWLKKLAIQLGIEEDILTDVLEKVKLKSEVSVTKEGKESDFSYNRKAKTRRDVLEERLIGLAVLFSDILRDEFEQIEEGWLSATRKNLWLKLKSAEDFDGGVKNELDKLALRVRYNYDDRQGVTESQIEPRAEWDLTKRELKKVINQEKIKRITLDIRRAEETNDDEAAEILLRELEKIKKDQ